MIRSLLLGAGADARRPLVALAIAATALAASPACVLSQGPDPPFRRLSSEDGLSSNSVYAILEDRRGFLWFGTVDGLDRFDGYDFVVYRHDPTDPASLSSNVVHALLEDPGGTLWVGTERGLDRSLPTGGFAHLPAETTAGERDAYVVHGMDLGAEGALWVATNVGLRRLADDGSRLVVPEGWDLEDSPTPAVAVGPQGMVTGALGPLNSQVTGLFRLDPLRGRLDTWPPPPGVVEVNALMFDGRGELWMEGTAPMELPPPGGRWDQPPPGGPLHAWAWAKAPDGAVWSGTTAGLIRIDPDGSRRTLLPEPDSPTWLHNYVRSLAFDRAGTLWVGTYAGVYRHDPNAKRFQVLRHDPADPGSLAADAVSTFVEEPDGTLWVGTFGGGLDRIAPDGTVVHHRHRDGDPSSLPSDVVWAVHRMEDGVLWVATDGGLVRMDPARRRFESVPLIRPDGEDAANATALATGPGGRLWIGSFGGLWSLAPAESIPRPFEPLTRAVPDLAGREVHWIEPALDGTVLWVGMADGHVGRLNPTTDALVVSTLTDVDGSPLRSEGVWQLAHDERGRLWAASGQGLSRLDEEGRVVRHYDVADGLPGSVVYSLVADGPDRLWLGTNGGLVRFHAAGDEGAAEFRVYGAADGIAGNEFNRSAVARLSDGRLAFGGVDGMTIFHPDEVRDNPYVPPVVVTGIRVGDRDPREVDPMSVDRVVLGPQERTFVAEFAALSYTMPERNRYAYRLEGWDEEWVEAGTARSVRYANLPSGDYVLRVRASNEDGVWNEDGTAVAIRVLPRFWETAWFRLLLVAVLAGALVAAHRLRVRRLLEVERMRLRIARDLHDDLGTDLSAIALTADVVARSRELPEDASRRLAQVRATALSKVEALRDIVWMIDPEHDSLAAVGRRLRAVAERLGGAADVRVEVEPDILEHAVVMGVRRQLVLFLKEALHNAVRHADADTIVVRLARREGALRVEVEDDGTGFDPEAVDRTGNGLRNLRARAREMDGRMEVRSRPGHGTRISLELSMARVRHGGPGPRMRA